VGWPQIVSGALLVAMLLFVALYYGWRQVRALRDLGGKPNLPAEEMRYERGTAYRRLFSSVLMLVLAGLLSALLVYLENPTQRVIDRRDAEGAPAPLTPQEKDTTRVWGWTWIAFLLVLLAVVLLAAIDLLATRRYGLKQYRKLQADRRAMLERQVGRMRRERNGDG
jgi:uncharacterized membrane protein YbhN (UPF0104 family)